MVDEEIQFITVANAEVVANIGAVPTKIIADDPSIEEFSDDEVKDEADESIQLYDRYQTILDLISDNGKKLLATQLWERYGKLNLTKEGKLGGNCIKAINLLQKATPKTIEIVTKALFEENNENMSYDNKCYYIIKNIIEDNATNRYRANKIVNHARRSKHEGENDNNYLNSTGRKMKLFNTKKEFGAFSFVKDFDVACEMLWPNYSCTQNNVMWTTNQARRQGFYTDYTTFGDEFNMMSY